MLNSTKKRIAALKCFNFTMTMSPIFESIYNGLLQTSWLELIAVIAGIASVWYSRKESILVYPIGLINTTIYIYLSFKGHLLGEASVNLYYTLMSLWGWYLWTRVDPNRHTIILQITNSNMRDWFHQIFINKLYCVLHPIFSHPGYNSPWCVLIN